MIDYAEMMRELTGMNLHMCKANGQNGLKPEAIASKAERTHHQT
jgi:hypothetical protein